ncbi:MAG: phosphoribosylaminoimidazolesuccinocarboxamide synthase [bacterium]|nr:phosphoribosylaminoimidazolesuccinocarboxamide synthase [bacterium]
MIEDEIIKKQIGNALLETDFDYLGDKYKGKVRDTYKKDDKMVIVTTDRISAFDRVLGTIPFKGQVLNQMTAFWFEKTKDDVKNHVIDIPDPNVMVVKKCEPLPIEIVVRGYMTGSMWRSYEKGEEIVWKKLPEGMKKDQKFDEPLLTPSTKADTGHDMPISREDIVKSVLPEEEYKKIEEAAIKLFNKGTEMAAKQGLILVDTKYEFGKSGDEYLVVDEIHTPDSSRYWVKEGYEERFEKGEEQQMLDKEYLRQWLIKERNFMGDGAIPELPDEIKIEAAKRYIELFERITGQKFKGTPGLVDDRIRKNLQKRGYT